MGNFWHTEFVNIFDESQKKSKKKFSIILEEFWKLNSLSKNFREINHHLRTINKNENGMKKFQNFIEVFEENLSVCLKENKPITEVKSGISLLLYLYHMKITTQNALAYFKWQPNSIKVSSEICQMLNKVLSSTNLVIFLTINILKRTDVCVCSIDNEYKELAKTFESKGEYLKSFQENIHGKYLRKSIDRLDFVTLEKNKQNFSIWEKDLLEKITKYSSGGALIQEYSKNVEALYKQGSNIMGELAKRGKVKKFEDEYTLFLKLLIACKKFYFQSQTKNNPFTNGKNQAKIDLENVLKKILSVNQIDYKRLMNACGCVNKSLFPSYKNLVTHPSCHDSFQKPLSNYVFVDENNPWIAIIYKYYTFDINSWINSHRNYIQGYHSDHNLAIPDLFNGCYSKEFIEWYSFIFSFKDQAEKACLVLFLNYVILYLAINENDSQFPYFNADSCGEMGPFCKEENTQIKLDNLLKFSNFFSYYISYPPDLTAKYFNIRNDLLRLNNDLYAKRIQFGVFSDAHLIDLLQIMQKLRLLV